MSKSYDTIEAAISELDVLKKNLKKSSTRQISNFVERAVLKATAGAWFSKHKTNLSIISVDLISPIELIYDDFLKSSDKNPSRQKILTQIKVLRKSLIDLRSHSLKARPETEKPTTDIAPDFTPLISDPEMCKILIRRWNECVACITHKIPLSGTVMIGGFIEGLLIAKINQQQDQSIIFKANSAPIDKKTNKPKSLSEWSLSDLINLSHELKWISKPTKDIGTVLREYRNYIHPHKELSNKIIITSDDTTLFWELAKNICRQLLGM